MWRRVEISRVLFPPILWCVALCFLVARQAAAGDITLPWSANTAAVGDVTLQWDANTEADLAGYKVYVGIASRAYSMPVTIGQQTTYTVTGLAPGIYYFAVTAINTAGLESDFSNEVHTTVPDTGGGTPCDLNSDGQRNISDVQILINALLAASSNLKYDINKDGRVDIVDVQTLVNVVLGLRSCP